MFSGISKESGNCCHSPEVLRHVYEKSNIKRPFLEGFKVFRELLVAKHLRFFIEEKRHEISVWDE